MAGVKISALPAVTPPLLSADLLPLVQAGVTDKVTLQQLLDFILDSFALNNGELLIGSTGNPPVASTLTAGSMISIINSAGGITISASGSAGFAWTVVSGTTQAMVTNNGYISDNAGLVTLTLPVTASVGDELSIIGHGGGGWLIAQNALQNIQIGSGLSTVGIGGSVASTNRYDSLDLVCIVANTVWAVLGAPQTGGLTIV